MHRFSLLSVKVSKSGAAGWLASLLCGRVTLDLPPDLHTFVTTAIARHLDPYIDGEVLSPADEAPEAKPEAVKAEVAARTSTDAPPAPWREGVESCDRTIDEFRVMLSKRPAAQPSWRCLHRKTENEPVVDWCRLCRAGRIRVSLAIAS